MGALALAGRSSDHQSEGWRSPCAFAGIPFLNDVLDVWAPRLAAGDRRSTTDRLMDNGARTSTRRAGVDVRCPTRVFNNSGCPGTRHGPFLYGAVHDDYR
jgi:hypothetical protein